MPILIKWILYPYLTMFISKKKTTFTEYNFSKYVKFNNFFEEILEKIEAILFY